MNVKDDAFSLGAADFAALDDAALLSWRAEAREELDRLPPRSIRQAELTARYDLSTGEVEDRARRAWTGDR
jgi:hypothetical protein